MLVQKFGGTSVGKPERMKHIAELTYSSTSTSPKIVVLSALSGTTNTLVLINEAAASGHPENAKLLIDNLQKHYKNFIEELYATNEGKSKGWAVIAPNFETIESCTKASNFGNKEKNIILAQGELMSTALFEQYMLESGRKAKLIPALSFMVKDEFGEPHLESIEKKLAEALSLYPEHHYFITQGYICLNHKGEIDNLKRGGSDYTATLVGAAIRSSEVQIWTDIDGMHNNDPRIVDKTQPIQELSFDEAAELAYFGAKILHPQTVLPAKKFGIPVRLLNTMEPEKPGTVITERVVEGAIKAVAAKDGITAIKVKSGRMLLAYGFMRRIFEIFEKYQTSIDMVTTSEVAVSITIDSTEQLNPIKKELEELGQVEIDTDQSIICIVGYMPENEKSALQKIFDALGDIPIRMVSYGGSRYNVSVLVHSQYKDAALRALNKGVFNL